MLVRVKVFPRSNRDELLFKKEGVFEARVRAPAKNNEANEAVNLLLKKYFPTATSIYIVRGKTRPNKIFEIREPQGNLL